MSVAEGNQPAGRGNSTDSLRRHNLAVVLELVHHAGGISRSQLTRATGLNRSTVAALVGELVERRLVLEVDSDVRAQVGRPSPIVKPGPLAVVIAINPEIDAVTIAVVGLGGEVIKRIRYATDHEPTAREAVNICAAVIDGMRAELEAGHRVVGVGLAVPGLVRSLDGVVRLAPHLGWVDEPVAAMLAAATGYPVVAGNDARLGTLAESTFGAGRDLSDFIYLNGGASGIGGGVIAGGSTLAGAAGYAGEFGHTLVNSAGVVCHCGGVGCLETEVRRAPLLELVGLTDADSDELESALLASSSAVVLTEVHRQLDFLAVALRNAINTLNPQTILLGGFLGSLYAVAPAHLNALVAHQPLRASREGVTIGRAALGANLLMIGAAELAFASVLTDPATF
ncbi:putative NBD/HSP70 family sugar kinase [Conyzicola lurida]|uniref:Putative NBD/HSP70 family sugar kinase n=1 Tax=Conyzicola lurida TaxID=1172621 RepID=A0A841ARS1_9MICO|nr:putative NBD/HSP70 family sugar kinase [Conyzicola lurida]